jgi:RNA polymerase sigma-70 factor (ECF subfamily)
VKEKTNPKRNRFKSEVLSHLDSLLRTALYITGNEKKAGDLTEETFRRTFRVWDSGIDKSDFRTRLYKTLTGLLSERHLLPAPSPQVSDLNESGEYKLEEHFWIMAAGGDDTDNLCHEVSDETIKNAIWELPVDLRFLIVLSFIEGFSYQEIAGIAKTDIGTVRLKLIGGRKLLQDILWKQMIKDGLLKSFPAYDQ